MVASTIVERRLTTASHGVPTAIQLSYCANTFGRILPDGAPMHRFFAAATGFALTIMGSSSHAQTIYPIDRAEILLGARCSFSNGPDQLTA